MPQVERKAVHAVLPSRREQQRPYRFTPPTEPAIRSGITLPYAADKIAKTDAGVAVFTKDISYIY